MLTLLLSIACGTRDGSAPAPTLDSPAIASAKSAPIAEPPDAQADSQFRRFLSLSIATRRQFSGMVDPVYTCPEDENFLQVRWIADSRVSSIRIRGDTAEAVAIITTVVRQIPGNRDGDYIGQLAIREDTGTWRMVRDASAGARWKVCGDEIGSHFGIFRLGNISAWEPPGASREAAFKAIDSIRLARGLELAR